MAHKISSKDKAIKVYAEHYHNPISDFKGFNKVLKQNTGFTTTKKKIIKILGY